MKPFRIQVLIVALVWITGCNTMESILTLQKPKARLTGVSFDEINLTSATILFNVEIENPYTVSLPLTNMDYALSTGDNPLLSGNAEIASFIDAKSTKEVSLPAKISYLEVVKAFKNFKPGAEIPYKADLGMSVDTPALGTLKLPTTKKGIISVPIIPKTEDINWNTILDKISEL